MGNKGSALEFLDVKELGVRIGRGPRTVNESFQLWVVYNVIRWEATL